jgi:hypothetical protein
MIAATYESATKNLLADSWQTLTKGIPGKVLAKEAPADEGRTRTFS